MKIRSLLSLAAILAAGIALAIGASLYWSSDYAVVRQRYIAASSADARFVADKLESTFASMYQNIRTISMLPSIRTIDRHGTGMSDEGRTTIQQIYNNLATNVAVSEVYILPVDFDPEKIDPVTGHHETPILAFDELIAPSSGGDQSAGTDASADVAKIPPDQDFAGIPDAAGVPQIEIEEYRELKQQLSQLQQTYPTLDKIQGMSVPMLGSPELITCDNTEFDSSHNDADRKGLIQLVPFYGMDGKLKGGVAAIMRSNAYRALLPPADYSLVNTVHGFATRPSANGQEAASAQYVQRGAADPRLIYSEAIPLHTPDAVRSWVLWAGHDDKAFTASNEAITLRNSEVASYVGIAALVLAGFGVVYLVNRNQRVAARAAAELEARVADRTAEISELATAAEAESDRRLASINETGSLNASIARVVGAALEGDFSQRVDVDPSEATLAALAGNVNALVETVDRSIADTGDVLAALARTDLTHRVRGTYKGALGRLKDDTNLVGSRLAEVVLQLRDASGEVRRVTSELLQGVNDLAERTSRQAAGLEEATAAIERLDSTTADIARQAGSANGKVGAVAKAAGETGAMMGRANEAMNRISAASSKIGDVIALIDDIAFQTNLLALNASVEAARAGDAGAGFAVVAVEVRRLAQSAATASSQVKDLVETAIREVADGNRIVADATASLDGMLAGIRENSELVGGIARATQEQSGSISELSGAVRQIDEMTQHNAALVEETNAAIEKTEAQANELDRLVDIFVVDEAAPLETRRAA